jgi:hypothetical protein
MTMDELRDALKDYAQEVAAFEAATRRVHQANATTLASAAPIPGAGGAASSGGAVSSTSAAGVAAAQVLAPFMWMGVVWDPIALLFEVLRLHFELVTAEKVKAFEDFKRKDGETATEAAGRLKEICKKANKVDNDRRVAKWMNSLSKMVRRWVEEDARYRTPTGLLPGLEVVLDLTNVAEIHLAMRTAVDLGGEGSSKTKDKEVEKERKGERGSWDNS